MCFNISFNLNGLDDMACDDDTLTPQRGMMLLLFLTMFMGIYKYNSIESQEQEKKKTRVHILFII